MSAPGSPGKTLPKYDAVTRCLHTGLAAAVVIDLALLSVMRVPPGPGLGVSDWHRDAFEFHCRFGPVVAILCLLHWLWISLPFARPGIACLFPWLDRERRTVLAVEIRDLARLKLPSAYQLSPLAGSVQGLGLCAVTASVIGGSISYLGYYTPVPIPGQVLHWCALELIFSSYLVWTFVLAHGLVAMTHQIAAYRREVRERGMDVVEPE